MTNTEHNKGHEGEVSDERLLVAALLAWLDKRSQPDSGIRYSGPPNDGRGARVEFHGSDATFVAEHFHGQGARDLAAAILSSITLSSTSEDETHFDRTRCATEGCGKVATQYFERGGVGSYYCDDCAHKISAHRDGEGM